MSLINAWALFGMAGSFCVFVSFKRAAETDPSARNFVYNDSIRYIFLSALLIMGIIFGPLSAPSISREILCLLGFGDLSNRENTLSEKISVYGVSFFILMGFFAVVDLGGR